MSLFKRVTEIKPLLNANATPAWGNLNFEALRIPRQSRRLETIYLHFNVTTGGTSGANSTSISDKLEGLVQGIRLRVSDVAGSNRLLVSTNGPSCLLWHRKMNQRLGRNTQGAFGATTTATAATYDLVYPIHIRHPLINEPIGNRLSLPLDARFLGEDPKLELDMADAEGLIGCTNRGGSFAINAARAKLVYREVPDNIIYVPQELYTQKVDGPTAAGAWQWDFPKQGWLASFMVEGYTTKWTVRADALSAGKTADYYFLKYGRSELLHLTNLFDQEENDYWQNDLAAGNDAANQALIAAGTVTRNDMACFMQDFLHDRTHDDALSPGTCINLYSDNTGDSLRLQATSLAANSGLKVTTHKFFIPSLDALVGA
jgi:hypothetical protein